MQPILRLPHRVGCSVGFCVPQAARDMQCSHGSAAYPHPLLPSTCNHPMAHHPEFIGSGVLPRFDIDDP